MKTDSKFKSLQEEVCDVNFVLFGKIVSAPQGTSLAAAILSNSCEAFRETKNGDLRSAYCMMGVCFDCLVEVNGKPNIQSCMVLVHENMIVRRQEGLHDIAGDQNG